MENKTIDNSKVKKPYKRAEAGDRIDSIVRTLNCISSQLNEEQLNVLDDVLDEAYEALESICNEENYESYNMSRYVTKRKANEKRIKLNEEINKVQREFLDLTILYINTYEAMPESDVTMEEALDFISKISNIGGTGNTYFDMIAGSNPKEKTECTSENCNCEKTKSPMEEYNEFIKDVLSFVSEGTAING